MELIYKNGKNHALSENNVVFVYSLIRGQGERRGYLSSTGYRSGETLLLCQCVIHRNVNTLKMSSNKVRLKRRRTRKFVLYWLQVRVSSPLVPVQNPQKSKYPDNFTNQSEVKQEKEEEICSLLATGQGKLSSCVSV